jgi:chemotaxis signal transduction protein
MMRTPQSGDDGILCCDVGQERFAFRSRDVRHVERAEYMRADRGDDGRLGTLRLGGQQVPVFGLGDVLGRSSHDDRANAPDRHIAITGDRHSLAGWLVDRIARVAQPATGDIAPLPPIVGAQAASWFEGIVWLGEDESALLLAPHHLTAPAARIDVHGSEAAFERQRSAVEPESVAVVFSTTVLPAADEFRFALSGRQIAAIVQPTTPITVPGCNDFVDGVTWWRRTAVPVIDFRARADRYGTTYRRRLIVQCGPRQHGSLIAFSIDPGVFMCRPAAEHRLMPAVPCPPFASGVFDVNGEAVALLDLDALLQLTPS